MSSINFIPFLKTPVIMKHFSLFLTLCLCPLPHPPPPSLPLAPQALVPDWGLAMQRAHAEYPLVMAIGSCGPTNVAQTLSARGQWRSLLEGRTFTTC